MYTYHVTYDVDVLVESMGGEEGEMGVKMERLPRLHPPPLAWH